MAALLRFYYSLITVIGPAGFVLDEYPKRVGDVEDLPVDIALPADPGVFKIRREDDLVVGLNDIVDTFHDPFKVLFPFFLKADKAIIKARFDIKGVTLFVKIGVNEGVFIIHERFVLVKLYVIHIICQKILARYHFLRNPFRK